MAHKLGYEQEAIGTQVKLGRRLLEDKHTSTSSKVRKSKNFPDSKIFTKKTFRIKCVSRDIDDFATNARKT